MLLIITLLVSLIAAVFGVLKAKQKGGDRADQIQWGLSYGLIGFVFSMLLLAILAYFF